MARRNRASSVLRHDTAVRYDTMQQRCDTDINGLRQGRLAHKGERRVRVLATMCRDTIFCIVAGGQRHGSSALDTALRYGAQHLARTTRRATSATWSFVSRYNFCIATGGRRHYRRRAATWAPVICDMAPSVRCARSVRAAWV